MKYLYYLSLVLLLLSCQRAPKENIYYIMGDAQGTTYNITYIAQRPIEKKEVDSLLQVIDLSMSTYIDNSLISKVNRNEHLPLDAHFQKVFHASEQIYKVFLEKENPAIQLNFNAIAQGYTSDVIADYFLSKQIENFIVEVGGELFIHGKNTLKGKSWLIGIDNPLQKPDEDREIVATVELTDCGLATSGNYRKLWTDSLTGKKYVHTLNPQTGYPQTSNLLSATVIAPSAMLADGYATTLMALGGLEKAKAFLATHKDLKAILLYADDQHKDKIQRYVTENFEVHFEPLSLSPNPSE